MDKEKIEKIQKLKKEKGFSLSICSKILELNNWSLENIESSISVIAKEISEKKKDKETPEGVVFTKQDGNTVQYAIVRCETDFVARSEDFLSIEEYVFDQPDQVQNIINEQITRMSENIKIEKRGTFEGNYFHSQNEKIFIAIKTNTEDKEINQKIALHILSISSDIIDTIYQSPWYLDSNIITREYLKEKNVQLYDALLLEL